MTKIKITVTNCEPNDKAPHASKRDLDKFEWKNHDGVDHTISFAQLTAPIFAGYGNAPVLALPAHGSVEVELLDTAPEGRHDYEIDGSNCQPDDSDPGAIVVDP